MYSTLYVKYAKFCGTVNVENVIINNYTKHFLETMSLCKLHLTQDTLRVFTQALYRKIKLYFTSKYWFLSMFHSLNLYVAHLLSCENEPELC